MSNRRGGLGKGLSSLIPAGIESHVDGPYSEIDINRIVANPNQPRDHFDEEALAALTSSIIEVGVIQPIVVRVVDSDTYELIAGERRWQAAKRAGLALIPALIRRTDAKGSLETAIVENLHRKDLNPLEEAAAYRQLIDEFGLTQREVAKRVGRSRSAVANTIRLMQLPSSVQRLLAEGQLSAGHAKALLATADRKIQEDLARRIVSEGLTVRNIEDVLSGIGAELANPSLPTGNNDDDPVANRASPRSRPTPPGVLELEELLASRLQTRVEVKMGKGPGRITVDFADLADLERIYRIISPHGTVV